MDVAMVVQRKIGKMPKDWGLSQIRHDLQFFTSPLRVPGDTMSGPLLCDTSKVPPWAEEALFWLSFEPLRISNSTGGVDFMFISKIFFICKCTRSIVD